jgi:ABC-2 type transport system permease protein
MIYIDPADTLSGAKAFIYPIYTVIFISVGYILYKFRNLENNREVVAFAWLRPVFMYIATFCFCTAAFLISDEGIIISIIIGAFTIAATFMLIRKSVTIKGIFKYMLIYFLAYGAVFCTIKFDLTGFQTRVPELSDIESARIISPYSYDETILTGTNYSQLSSDEIKYLVSLHNDIVNNIDDNSYFDDYYGYVAFEYKLKNGTSMKRKYPINCSLADNNMELFHSWGYIRYMYPSLRDDGHLINRIKINYIQDGNETSDKYVDYNKYDKFMAALKSDIQNIIDNTNSTIYDISSYDAVEKSADNYVIQISINYCYVNSNDNNKEREIYNTDVIYINDKYTNTLNFLNKKVK